MKKYKKFISLIKKAEECDTRKKATKIIKKAEKLNKPLCQNNI
tara:strand:- start:2223 stop:2351 length:129 start_codon:yes stop_codon:yes gene_type:complete